jgi:hypothetical protein
MLSVAGAQSSCPAGWVSYIAAVRISGGSSAVCPPVTSTIWIVALVCTCVCTVVVGVAFIHLLFRLNILRSHGSNDLRPNPVPSRVLNRIPTFKYSGRQRSVPDTIPAENEDNADGAMDEGTCSICLAEFVEGDELRMLGCLHVFHSQCIDQWLAISRECPLCKRDVAEAAAAADPADLAGTAFAALQGRSYDAARVLNGARRRGTSRPWRCLGGRRAPRAQAANVPAAIPDNIQALVENHPSSESNNHAVVERSSAVATLMIVASSVRGLSPEELGVAESAPAHAALRLPSGTQAPSVELAAVGGPGMDAGDSVDADDSADAGNSANVGDSAEVAVRRVQGEPTSDNGNSGHGGT